MQARLLLLAILSVAVPYGTQAAPASGVTVRVEQVVSNDSNKAKHAQERSLKIHLSNSSSKEFPALKIKYYHLGRDLKDGDSGIEDTGEMTASLKPLSTEIVQTPKATSKYTEEHSVRVNKGNKRPFQQGKRKGGNGNNVRMKKVEASGTRLTGYAVKVYSGSELVAEAYSSPGVKDEIR